MRPNLHPRLVNGRFGDPALFVPMLHRKDALLFDAGDLSALGSRDLLRITHLFLSHMHIDHFIGFDALLRVNVGREKLIRIVGPAGSIVRVGNKLRGYEWDLVDRYRADLVFEVIEVGGAGGEAAARFRFRKRFERERIALPDDWDRPAGLRIETALLEHHGPCLGFAVSEPAHANVWKSRLEERGLPTGQWLKALKNAVVAGLAGDRQVELPGGMVRPLRDLRELVTISRGQKVAYVTDVADTATNRERIGRLARHSDIFFLEARFAACDAAIALERAHLTTTAAGQIARCSGARRLEPFHFSPRYEGDEARMIAEVFSTFDPHPKVRKKRTR